MRKLLALLIMLALCISVCSCKKESEMVNVWETATYIENTEIGEGSKVFITKVVAEEKSVEITVNTDKEKLSDALLEHNLISGDDGAYGLFVTTVNGILADYDTTKSYWSVKKNGEYMLTGVDVAEINNGDIYEFIYTKN